MCEYSAKKQEPDLVINDYDLMNYKPVAEFKEFERRFKYGWFHLKFYQMFQDLSRRLVQTGFWRI